MKRTAVLLTLLLSGTGIFLAWTTSRELTFLEAKLRTLPTAPSDRRPNPPDPWLVEETKHDVPESESPLIVQPAHIEASLQNRTSSDRLALSDQRLLRLYDPFLKGLHLAPEKLERIRALIAQRNHSAVDAMSIMADTPSALTPEELQKGLRAGRAEIEKELKKELGPTDFVRYNTYNGTMVTRERIDRINDLLVANGRSLAEDQTEKIVALTKKVQGKVVIISPGFDNDSFISLQQLKNKKIIEGARGIMTPEQLTLFEQGLNVDLARMLKRADTVKSRYFTGADLP